MTHDVSFTEFENQRNINQADFFFYLVGDQQTTPLSLQTKAVNEVRVDPFNEYRFTSFEENIVSFGS